MTETDRRVIAERLREARTAVGLTQQDVADAIGIGRTAVAALEAAERNLTGSCRTVCGWLLWRGSRQPRWACWACGRR